MQLPSLGTDINLHLCRVLLVCRMFCGAKAYAEVESVLPQIWNHLSFRGIDPSVKILFWKDSIPANQGCNFFDSEF
jgi:hypothetical protein